ncbi:MAG: hypothetical protein JWN14_1246 [Chthonomonadales bacterium]|nr:hypothetical protein [Chthonomonadales bacterium]
MERYIVRYTKPQAAPSDDLHQVKSFPGVAVADATDRMVLIEASPETASSLASALPEWSVSAEQLYTIPDPRPRILHSPDDN